MQKLNWIDVEGVYAQSDFEHPLHSFKIDDSRDAPLSKGCALNEGMCPNKEMRPDTGM